MTHQLKNNTAFFFLLITLAIVLGVFSRYFLAIDELYYETLSSSLTTMQIEEILSFQEKWQWLGYLFVPIILALKITLISAVIYLGLFFFDKELKFKKVFSLVTKAEFVFIVVAIVKLIWLYFQNDYTLQDIQYFYPLSALNIVGYEGLSPWFIYPFQVLNLFELAYWFVLAYLIGKELNIGTEKGFTIVASSYGPALLIWVVAIMFFTLNVS